jgi:hypothetical protein
MTEDAPSQPEAPEPSPPSEPPASPPQDLDTSPFPQPTFDRIDAGLPGGVDLELSEGEGQ